MLCRRVARKRRGAHASVCAALTGRARPGWALVVCAQAAASSPGARGAAGEELGEVDAILAACAVADSTGDWTSLRFLITWRGCAADDVWDVPLSAFGSTPAACLAAADAVLADSYDHFAYLGVPSSAFRCETLLKVLYVNWRHFNGAWLGAPAAVALAGERRQRLSRVADSFPVSVPAMSDAAYSAATGRAPEFAASWVNPNAPAKAAKAEKAAKGPKKEKKDKAPAKPKAKLAKVAKPAKAPKAAKAAKPAAERKKPGPKPKAKAAKAAESEEEEEDAGDDMEDDEDFSAPKKAAATPKSAAKAGAAGATPKRKPGRPPKILPLVASPAEAAVFAAAAVAKASTPAKSPAKRGRPAAAARS